MRHSIIAILLFFAGPLFSQSLTMETSKTITYNPGTSIFIWQNNTGLIHLSNSDDKKTQITVYDEVLDKKLSASADKNLLDEKYVSCVEEGEKLHFLFNRNRLIGFANRGFLYDLTLSGSKVSITEYKFPGALNICHIGFENNKMVLYGGELYKPWDVPRVLKFAISPFLLFTPLILPKSPSTRPVIANLSNGEIDLLYRKQFKTKEYKNKLIHDMYFNDDGSKWIAMTNGIKPGKSPLYLEKYDVANTLTYKSKYSTAGKERVSMFRFTAYGTTEETANFTIGFGNKVLSGPIVKRAGIQSLIGVYEGEGGEGTGKEGTLKSVESENYRGTANDPFSRDVPSTLEKTYTAKFGDSIYDIFMSCRLMPLTQSSKDATVLIGYYVSAPYITVKNTATGGIQNYQILNPDPKGEGKVKKSSGAQMREAQRLAMLGHFCYPEYLTSDVFYAAVVQDSSQFYICYINPEGELVTYETDNSELNEVSKQKVSDALKKTSGHGSNYRIISISETKMALLVTEEPQTTFRKSDKKAKTVIKIFHLD